MTDNHGTSVAADGQIRVCRRRCSTCIFEPGNLKDLRPGRVAELVRETLSSEGHIVCHSTLDSHGAICRGFADNPLAHDRSLALRTARALDVLTEIDPPDRGQHPHMDLEISQSQCGCRRV
ncbi:hypothetical protein AB0H71_31905 [Nocardia sp. NPDC050697]|uniref:hypothetical protein n=1 Tax=Nocardia sp. NPDC050697 TaxID=3155158 RepID=UPI0033D65B77